MPIVSFGSTVGARMQPETSKAKAQITEDHFDHASTGRDAIDMLTREISTQLDLRENAAAKPKELTTSAVTLMEKSNGTVTPVGVSSSVGTLMEATTQRRPISGNHSEKPMDLERTSTSPEENAPAKAPWTSLFARNRCATNGMSLSYIPPKIVNGQPMAQLVKSEVNKEHGSPNFVNHKATYRLGYVPTEEDKAAEVDGRSH